MQLQRIDSTVSFPFSPKQSPSRKGALGAFRTHETRLVAINIVS